MSKVNSSSFLENLLLPQPSIFIPKKTTLSFYLLRPTLEPPLTLISISDPKWNQANPPRHTQNRTTSQHLHSNNLSKPRLTRIIAVASYWYPQFCSCPSIIYAQWKSRAILLQNMLCHSTAETPQFFFPSHPEDDFTLCVTSSPITVLPPSLVSLTSLLLANSRYALCDSSFLQSLSPIIWK